MKKCKHGHTDFYTNGRCKICARQASLKSRAKKNGKQISEVSLAEALVKDEKPQVANYQNKRPRIRGKMVFYKDSGLIVALARALVQNPEATTVYIDGANFKLQPRQIRVGERTVHIEAGPCAPFCFLIGKEL